MFFLFSVPDHLVLLVVGDVLSELRYSVERGFSPVNVLDRVPRVSQFWISVRVVVQEYTFLCKRLLL